MKHRYKTDLNTRNKFQKRFFPNPKISLLILDELKNLGFEERGEIHEIEGARSMDSLQDWR
jgi:hypothetical protein